tara:strand:- start:470 stop:580 length:111 start_codon:yes stop_codon:yes gene_type:complete
MGWVIPFFLEILHGLQAVLPFVPQDDQFLVLQFQVL